MQKLGLLKPLILNFLVLFTLQISAQDCNLTDLFVEAQPCLDSGEFYVDFEFNIENAGNQGFTVRGNGVIYNDNLAYGETFYTIGPLQGDCTTLYEFVVIDNEDDNCQAVYEFDEPICCEEDCEIEVTDFFLSDCDSLGYRILTFEVSTAGNTSDGFTIYYDNIPVTQFEYGNNPYSITIPGLDYVDAFNIVDSEDSGCNDVIRFDLDDCDNIEECDFLFTNVDRIFECSSDSTYFAYLDFRYSNPADSFYLIFEYGQPEVFAYTDLPISLGEFLISNELFTFFIYEKDNPYCYTSGEWNDAPDCSEFSECYISNVFAEAHDCNDDGMFYVDIEFDSENTGELGFEIRGNGVSYGDTFEYGQVFYSIGPLDGDCSTLYEFVIIDNANPDCNNATGFTEPICCNEFEECDIRDIEVSEFDCNEDGTYNFVLDFVYENNTNEFFDVWAGNAYFGFYRYEDLPLKIDSFVPRDVQYDLIRICDNDNLSCCAMFEFIGPDCEEENECSISNVYAEAHECNDDGLFYVDIEFDSENTGELGFEIRGNGVSYGDTFEYGQVFYTIGPLVGDCSTLYEFVIIDNANGSCNGDFGFEEPVCCNTDECQIEVTAFTLGECDSLGYKTLTFEIGNEGESTEGFDIYFSNLPIAHFEYGNNPYTILIPGYDHADRFRVADSENPECDEYFNFDNEPCEEIDECNFLYSPIERIFECTSDSTYNVYADFSYTNPSDSFYLVSNFGATELFAYADLPILLGEFVISGELFDFFIYEQENPYCYSGNEWNDAPDCSEFVDCSISNVFAEATECNDDGTFYVGIEFESDNTGELGFEIRGNGVSYGDTFQYGQTFYTVGPLEGDCSTIYEFVIIDNANEECYGDFEFEEPICCGDLPMCDIRDIVVDSFDCHSDGTYSLVLDFIYEGNTNEFFDVWAGTEFIGYYSYADLPVHIDTFIPRDIEYDLIKICDNDNASCCTEYEFWGPNCETSSVVENRPIDQVDIYTFNKSLFIKNYNNINLNVTLYNTTGKKVDSINSNNSLNQNYNHLPDGLYIIKVEDRNRGGYKTIFAKL